jgi:hypothetical protein
MCIGGWVWYGGQRGEKNGRKNQTVQNLGHAWNKKKRLCLLVVFEEGENMQQQPSAREEMRFLVKEKGRGEAS